MARSGLPSAVATEIAKGSLRAAFIVKLDFPGGALNTTQAGFAVSYNGDTYNNDGRLMDVSGMNERTDGKAGLITLSLSPDSTVRSRIADDDWQYAKVYPRLVFMDGDYATLGVFSMGTYYMSTAQASIAKGQASIQLECEPLIVDLSRKNPVLPSSRDQQLRSSGDTYFDVTAAIQGMRFEWGGAASIVGGGSSVGRGMDPVISSSGSAGGGGSTTASNAFLFNAHLRNFVQR